MPIAVIGLIVQEITSSASANAPCRLISTACFLFCLDKQPPIFYYLLVRKVGLAAQPFLANKGVVGPRPFICTPEVPKVVLPAPDLYLDLPLVRVHMPADAAVRACAAF